MLSVYLVYHTMHFVELPKLLSGCVRESIGSSSRGVSRRCEEVTCRVSPVLLPGMDGSEGLRGLSHQDSRGTIDEVLVQTLLRCRKSYPPIAHPDEVCQSCFDPPWQVWLFSRYMGRCSPNFEDDPLL